MLPIVDDIKSIPHFIYKVNEIFNFFANLRNKFFIEFYLF